MVELKVGYLSRRSDNLIVGALLGPAALGIYSVGYRFLLLLTGLLTQTLTAVAYPVFSRLQGSPEGLRDGLYRASQLSALVAVPALRLRHAHRRAGRRQHRLPAHGRRGGAVRVRRPAAALRGIIRLHAARHQHP